MSGIRPRAPAKVEQITYGKPEEKRKTWCPLATEPPPPQYISVLFRPVSSPGASAVPNLSSTALAYASCVRRIVLALTLR